MASKSSLGPSYAAHHTMSNYLSASRSRLAWLTPTCCRNDSDDEDDPDTTSPPPPSLPDIPDAISVSVHPLSENPQCVTPPTLALPASPTLDHATSFPGSLFSSSLGIKTLVAAGHVTTQNLGAKKICWAGGVAECFDCCCGKLCGFQNLE